MPTFSETWLPYIYLYGVGGLFFLVGMIIIRKSKSLDLNKRQHRWWKKVLIFGFLYFMIVHFIMIIAALYW
ncbi:MAG: hypothetical protein HUU54_14785 [Ignavibacteriaceae bacterium]|nr:hypothetical protein [Ignavibacteriaceae bacterium]